MDTPHFWITNISKKAISLRDLNLSIQPLRSLNLLDKKHFDFTEEQLIQSAQSGSLYAKSHYVVVRMVPPTKELRTRIPQQENIIFPTKPRSAINAEKVNYEELNISDDQYAQENLDLAETDRLAKWKPVK